MAEEQSYTIPWDTIEARLHEMCSKLQAERDAQRSRLFGRRRPRTVTVERRVRGKRTVQELRHV
ncbi:hypothetical protein PL335_16695 (plasmid) [Sulfitobacter faviae]|uniref:hypothetical protein n=1 Tax=Sulfitobacter faviae TaxID=1775881 RepID=UPI002308367C|nr:hypothetical protein [Sulfitobacter faviae]WCE68614.1 hypothetical protein PL335_16695 [Sulfitobacter faviae]